MLAKCGNPECTRRFMRLSEGKLFWQEVPQEAAGSNQVLQMVWFCDDCAVGLPGATHSGDAEFSPVFRREPRARASTQLRAAHL